MERRAPTGELGSTVGQRRVPRPEAGVRRRSFAVSTHGRCRIRSWDSWSCRRAAPLVRRVRREKAVPFKERQKFPEIRFDDFPGCAELAADFFRDLWFAVTLLQKFEHPRADQIEPKHPAVSDVQDNGAVLGV